MSRRRGLRVLVVEDERLLAWQLGEYLEAAGHQVVGHADHATQALELAARLRPDLAVVDVDLAGKSSGIELVRQLGRHGDCEALFVTASVARLPSDLAGALGALAKPHTARGLRQAVAYAARRIAGEHAVPVPAILQRPTAGSRRPLQPGMREVGCDVPAFSFRSVLSPSAG